MPGAGLMCNNAASSASTEMGQGSFRTVKLVCKCTSSKIHGGQLIGVQGSCRGWGL